MAGNVDCCDAGDGHGNESEQLNLEFTKFDNQTQEERRELRQGYRVLINDLKNNKHDFIHPSSSRLDEALTETDQLYKTAKRSTEKVMDSLAVRIISSYGRQKALAVQTDFVRFLPEEFAEKVVTFVGGQQPGSQAGNMRISEEGWKALGKSTHKFFSKSPSFHLMSGRLPRDTHLCPSVPTKKKRNGIDRNVEKENINSQATVPKKLTSFDDGSDVGTSREVVRTLYYLQQIYAQHAVRIPLPYFHFVVDPQSFGRTIENIFYTSFLVKAGHARISLDDDKLPQIEPLTEEGDECTVDQHKSHQTIISLTPKDWREIVDVFHIKEAAIERT